MHPPEVNPSSLYLLFLPHQSVTPFLSGGPPPKKNLVSPLHSHVILRVINIHVVMEGTSLLSVTLPTCVSYMVASSRHSISQGAVQKTARGKIKKARQEEARERLWENLTKGRSGIPGSGIPSDWSILTDFVNTQALLTQMRYTIWWRSETFQQVINNKLDDSMEACLALEAIMKDQVEQLNTMQSESQQCVSTKKPRRTGKCEIVCK